MKMKISAAGFLLAAVLFAGEPTSSFIEKTVSAQEIGELPPAGMAESELPRDEITEEERESIKREIAASMAVLEREGRLPPARPDLVQLYSPLRPAAGSSVFHVEAISNYVDQNPAFPGQLRDWNCGTRTYDQASGYNHAGIDYFTFPFGWKMLDDNVAEIVAAAPGTIVLKRDGNFDRSCGFNNNQWNAVYVRHSDNSIAWYGHMKSGSLTSKAVGDTVAQGEKLGVVGSSGNSTGPHLHLELYDSLGQLNDPFQGTCNLMNATSWWVDQEPYRVTRLNALKTHSAPPVAPACPATEVTNEKTVFRPGETVYAIAYFRDQIMNQTVQYSLILPNGSLYTSWTQTPPQTYTVATWWWIWPLPTNAAQGTWKLRAAVGPTTYETNFSVAEPSVTVGGRVTTPSGQAIRNAVVSLIDAAGVRRTATTSSFGVYSFANVLPAGGNYTLTVASKRYRFSPLIRQFSADISNLDLVGQE